MRAAWDLAWLVEGERARERFRLKGGRRNSVNHTVASEFDPHAATELAMLIQRRFASPTTASSVGTPEGVNQSASQQEQTNDRR